MAYNWDLIEHILHEVQNSGGQTAVSDEYATAKASEGESVDNSQQLEADATQLRDLLLDRGFIEPRSAAEDGNRSACLLTARGSSLLALIDSSIPGNDHPRQVLDEQQDALDPATFDEVASKAQVA